MLKNRKNNQVINNNQIVSFRLIRSEDGTFQITKREAMNRTKHMIAFDRKLEWDEVGVGKNLEDDLGYKDEEKRDLGGLIENIFFRDVNVTVDSEDLEKAATVRDLYEMIWSSCIVLDEIGTKMMIEEFGKKRILRSKVTYKISLQETKIKTIKMIANDKGLNEKHVTVKTELAEYRYTDSEKKDLLMEILKDKYFGTYNIEAKIKNKKDFKKALVKVTTVGDIATIIYNTINGR